MSLGYPKQNRINEITTGYQNQNYPLEKKHQAKATYCPNCLRPIPEKSIDIKTPDRPLFENFIWDINDVARFLRVSVGHVYNLVSQKKIPYRKRGKLYFIPREIYDWIYEGVGE